MAAAYWAATSARCSLVAKMPMWAMEPPKKLLVGASGQPVRSS